MARAKTGSTPDITPMPFPGESPTVALAMAAGRKYGLNAGEEKPARAKPKRKAASKARSAKSKSRAKPARKTAAGRN